MDDEEGDAAADLLQISTIHTMCIVRSYMYFKLCQTTLCSELYSGALKNTHLLPPPNNIISAVAALYVRYIASHCPPILLRVGRYAKRSPTHTAYSLFVWMDDGERNRFGYMFGVYIFVCLVGWSTRKTPRLHHHTYNLRIYIIGGG